MARWFVEKASYLATIIGFKVGCFTARIVPQRWLLGFGDALAGLAFLLLRGYRRRSLNNLRVALPRGRAVDPRAIARRSLRNFFRACLEMVIALESSDEERRAAIPLVGSEHLSAAMIKGNGVIVLSAHLGNFFLLGTRLAMDGHPVHVLINQPERGRLAKLMDHYRAEIRLRTIHARPRPRALRQITAVLRAGGIVMIVADEYRKDNGVPTTLFGRTVLARRGPVTLAARTGAAIVPACAIRQPDDSLKVVIEPELDLVRSGRGRQENAENVARITRWLEKTVRAHPDQWNWMNIRWWEDNERAEIGDQRSEARSQRSEAKGWKC